MKNMIAGIIQTHFPLRTLAAALADYDSVTAAYPRGQKRLDRTNTSQRLWAYAQERVVGPQKFSVILGYAQPSWEPPGDCTDRSARPRPELRIVEMTDESMLAALAAKQSR